MSKKIKRKLGYLECYVGSNITPFNQLFDEGVNVLKEGFEGVDAILLWGGTDIHPSYYGEGAHPSSQVASMPNPSQRDVNEWKAMVYAKAHGIPIIGVCRGAQFLCAFAGGRLIQNVSGHNCGIHKVLCKVDDDEEYFRVTSAHHQMMYPFNVEHEMLAWCDNSLSSYYDASPKAPLFDMKGKVEPEVVYFPQVRGFAIQGHPEWMREKDDFVKWCMTNIQKYCFEEETVLKEAVA